MRGGTSDHRPNNLETFFCGRFLDLYTELDGHGHNYHVFLFKKDCTIRAADKMK